MESTGGGLRRSDARWDILGQQVFFAQRDTLDGPDKRLSMDAWDGYSANRDRVTQGFLDGRVRNPVVLTGDVHTHWAADLKRNYDDPASATVGAELVCSSITSGGDGADSNPADNATVKLNPHIRFLQQPTRLRPHHDHPGSAHGRLPGGAQGHGPGCAGAHPGHVRRRGPGAGCAADLRPPGRRAPGRLER